MKKLVFTAALLLAMLASNAQREYWGVTFAGGSQFINTISYDSVGLGVIYKTDKYGTHQQVVFNFDSSTGIRPDGMLTEAPNGKLYGFASQLSTNGGGCLYEFNPISYEYRIVKSFTFLTSGPDQNLHPGPNGGKPLLASNGKIYGTYTSDTLLPATCTPCPPAVSRFMKIFEYDPVTDIFKNVYTFAPQTIISNGSTNGTRSAPVGPSRMMQASNGKIYMTFENGEEGFGGFVTAVGFLYELIPSSYQVRLLYSYGLGNGASPAGTMVEYTPGVLYNTFNYGNTDQMTRGGIHKYDIATNTMSIVAYVDTITGGYLSGTLVKAGNKLYGTTVYGGWAPVPWNPWYERSGILFEFNPANNEIKNVYDYGYQGNPTPNYDVNGLSLNLLAFNDTLFGISKYSMFQYRISTGEIKHLTDFTGPNGFLPQTGTGLIQTCTKPYYTMIAADTVFATIGSPFSCTISSKNTAYFEWQKRGVLINDTDSTLHFNAFNISDTGSYSCKLTNECGTTVTKSIYIKVVSTTPVVLLNFLGVAEEQRAKLLWQTSAEYNNAFFEIERSVNGVEYTTVGRVVGNGTSTVQNSYQFIDVNFWQWGAAYYRLKQVDINGRYTYSNVVFLKFPESHFSISPNPAKGSFNITLPATLHQATALIYDNKGCLLKKQICRAGINVVDAGSWAAGQYVIMLTSSNCETLIQKIIIENN